MKNKKLLIAAGALLAAVAFAGYLFLSVQKPRLSRLRGGQDFNVILITLDTTRADKLGCYGFKAVETPVIDMLASRGIRFEKCYSTTPLTLPAHTSIMTGTLPPFHGIRDNGGFIVPPGIKTMAEIFKDRGYSTSAFVAAYVLDSKWGLNQGFDYYFDKFDLSKFETISLGSVQRPANEVINEALAWLAKNKDHKFFAWIHLYDPHSPYEPPPPYNKIYAGRPYLGEIAFADSQLGRLWQFLETNGLIPKTFMVLSGDHGESLGEHKEKAHGFFVYQGAIHVPLIVVTPFSKLQGKTSSRVASLIDILPTVCEMTGLPVPAESQGESLVSTFGRRHKDDRRLAYSETFFPRFHYGWSELTAVQDGRYKLILAPVPELYDLTEDPAEEKNLVYLQKDVFQKLSAESERFISNAGRNGYEIDTRKVDEETREKLAALGYIGSFSDPAKLKGKKLANPTEKIDVFNDLSRAREIGMSGKLDEAVSLIEGIIATDPDITDAYFALGNIYYKKKEFEKAITAFRNSLDKKPDDSFAVINIANSYISQKKYAEAEKIVLDYFKKGFSDPQLYFLLGHMYFVLKRYDEAVSYFQKCLALNSESSSSHSALAAIAIVRGKLDQAEEHVQAAMAINPRLSGVHYNLAQLLEKRGKPQEAVKAYLQEIEITPQHFRAMFNLSRLYRMAGQEDQEMMYLKKCMEAEPEFALSYFYLARLIFKSGGSSEEAANLVKKGLELKPDPEELPFGYFLLADIYSRLGETRLSAEFARKGQSLMRSK